MLRLWGRTTSSNVQKVMWLCAELALPYGRIDAGGPFGRTQEPAYLALNPNGLVPTIEDDDFVLWESNTILRYLANRHGAHAWYPVEPRARAQVEQWMDWSSTTFGPALFNAFWQLVRTPPAQRDAAVIAESVRKTATVLRIADAQLADRAFLCGDAPTLADVCIGVYAYRWFELPIERPDLPALRAWYDRLAQRQPYRDVVMIPIR